MRTVVLCLSSLGFAVSVFAATDVRVDFTLHTTDVYGAPLTQNRYYYVYRPDGLSQAVPVPVVLAMETVPGCDYEHLFIDNASKDKTVEILRELAAADKRVKVIVNTRNFGQVRSPYYALLQARGDAVMTCVADLQEPPELIPQFVEKWREGYKVVIGVKAGSRESGGKPCSNRLRASSRAAKISW